MDAIKNLARKRVFMNFRRQVSPLVLMFLFSVSAPLSAAIEIDVLASMTGTCMSKVAETDIPCFGVTYSHTPEGRSGFAIVIDDPNDDAHIITFSGEKGQMQQDDRYELTIDRMLLRFKDSPRVDGLPAPLIEASTGRCTQIGSLATRKVSSVTCLATDEKGSKYEFRFESDGSPANVMKIRVADIAVEEARAKIIAAHIVQSKCLKKAVDQGVLPRYRTAFILQCMEE